ncbi:hypothetical protein [Streptomyces sp. NPDC059916]|uniref:hypothetical protein n=1 Tax=Streptomyces sp. NPDC059916 TaxID=3347001 RepID=UPI00368B2AAA
MAPPDSPDQPTRREAVCAWLTANGINPNDVPNDADLAIDTSPTGRLIRCEVFERDLDGRIQMDVHDEAPARSVITVPLKTDPPTWWEPHIKPTRDQLLAATDRVRQLHARNQHTSDCEHCSERDYPDYSVTWPCPTIQALGEVAQ